MKKFAALILTSVSFLNLGHIYGSEVPASIGGLTPTSSSYTSELIGDATGRYTQKLMDDLYFTMTPLIRETAASWAKWTKKVSSFFSNREQLFDQETPKSLLCCGAGASEIDESVINNFLSSKVPSIEKRLWMATFSYEPLQGAAGELTEEDTENIEMAVSISLDKEAPVAVHMGIFRNPLAYLYRFSDGELSWREGREKDTMHPELSIKLHRLAACSVAEFRRTRGWKPAFYFMSSPVPKMQEIILQNMPKGSVIYTRKPLNFEKVFQDLYDKYECRASLIDYYGEFTLKSPAGEVLWETNREDPHFWLVRTARTAGGPLILVDYELLQSESRPAAEAVPGGAGATAKAKDIDSEPV